MALLIDGKAIAAQIKEEVKAEVASLKEKGQEIALAVIQVGADPASSVYVNNKKKACEYVGIKSLAYELSMGIAAYMESWGSSISESMQARTSGASAFTTARSFSIFASICSGV